MGDLRRGTASRKARARREPSVLELDQAALDAAAEQARRLAENLRVMAEIITGAVYVGRNVAKSATLKQTMARRALGYARANPDDLWAQAAIEKKPKQRFLVQLIEGEAAGVVRWEWRDESEHETERVVARDGARVAIDRPAAAIERSNPAVGSSVDHAVRRVLADFEGLYPEERGKIDRDALRTALLLWLDTDRGRRRNDDRRATFKSALGGGDKFAHLARAIAATGFGTTKRMLEKILSEIRPKRPPR